MDDLTAGLIVAPTKSAADTESFFDPTSLDVDVVVDATLNMLRNVATLVVLASLDFDDELSVMTPPTSPTSLSESSYRTSPCVKDLVSTDDGFCTVTQLPAVTQFPAPLEKRAILARTPLTLFSS